MALSLASQAASSEEVSRCPPSQPRSESRKLGHDLPDRAAVVDVEAFFAGDFEAAGVEA
jgi:hypothetical protein